MKKSRIFCFLSIITIFWGTICFASASETFYGSWKVKTEVTIGTVTELTNNEIKKFIGKKATYSDKVAKFDDSLLNNPKYLKTTVSNDDFLTGERIPLEKLGINEKAVTKIEVYSDNNHTLIWDSPGCSFYIKNKNSIIINYEGVYFELVREQ